MSHLQPDELCDNFEERSGSTSRDENEPSYYKNRQRYKLVQTRALDN